LKLLVTADWIPGVALVPLLREAGHDVRYWCGSDAPFPGAESVKGDVREPRAIHRALDGWRACTLAGLVSRDPPTLAGCTSCTWRARAICSRPPPGQAEADRSSLVLGDDRRLEFRRVADGRGRLPDQTVGKWPYYLSKIYEEKIAIRAVAPRTCRCDPQPLLLLVRATGGVSTQDIFRFLMGASP